MAGEEASTGRIRSSLHMSLWNDVGKALAAEQTADFLPQTIRMFYEPGWVLSDRDTCRSLSESTMGPHVQPRAKSCEFEVASLPLGRYFDESDIILF